MIRCYTRVEVKENFLVARGGGGEVFEKIRACTVYGKSKLITFLLHIAHGEVSHNFSLCLSILFPNRSS